MNTYKPMQRRHDLKWDYTCNGGPTGYCRPYRDFDDSLPIPESEREKHRATAHKHHDHGHDTAQEAADCYKDYLLDNRLYLDGRDSGTQCKCKVCGEWTQRYARVDGYHIYHLCETHLNRESVAQVYELSGDDVMWSS